ncbi:MAG: hypothetical protein OSB36_08575 [Longimicrobiales bacterium]|nr:hypothetical protein [Longimicrobiales bacterium]
MKSTDGLGLVPAGYGPGAFGKPKESRITTVSVSRNVLPMSFTFGSNVQSSMMPWTLRTSSKTSPYLPIIFEDPPQ